MEGRGEPERSRSARARVSSVLVIAVFVSGLLGTALAVIPQSAKADWCPTATLSRNPGSGYQGDTVNEALTLYNGRSVAVQIYSISVTFSWDGIQWSWGTMSIPAYSSETNTYSIILPSAPGDYTMDILANGQAAGDWLSSDCSWSGSFRVNALPPPPTVIVTANPSTGNAPLTVSFTATVSNGLAPFSYSWTFGDGSSATGASATHTYTSAGTYTVQVVATDSRSRSDSASMTVTVTSAGPFGGGGSDPLTWLILIVLVIVAVVVVAALASRSRKTGVVPPYPAQQPYQYPVQQPPQGPQNPPQGPAP